MYPNFAKLDTLRWPSFSVLFIYEPVFPFFFAGTYQLGSAVLGNPLDLSFISNPSFQGFWSLGNDLFITLWVGGLIVGIPCGILFYFLGLWAAPRLIEQYAKAKNRLRK